MLRFKKHLQENYQLTEKDWDTTKTYFEALSFPKNEYFVQQGKVCHRLAFVEEGVLRLCMERDGEDITCNFICQNEFTGDPDSFTTKKPSQLNQQALTHCTLITISLDSMQKMYNEWPKLMEIGQMINRNVCIGLLNQRSLFYNLDASAKYKKFIDSYPHILQEVPLGYIASFLGITQPSLSRLRKQMS